MSIIAAAIDPGTIASVFNNGLLGGNSSIPVWESGGNLYVVGIHQAGGADSCGIWKSTDGGVSWTIQDDTNEPSACSMFVNVLVGTTMYVLAAPLASDPSDQALRLFSFDCSTDSWALVSGGGPSAHWTGTLVANASGDLIFAYGKLGGDDVWLGTYASGTWTALIDLTTVTTPGLSILDVYGCIDQDDRSHFVFHALVGSDHWHVSVSPDLTTVGTPDLLPDASGLGETTGVGIVAVGTSIFIGCQLSGGNASVIEGTPLSAPAFTAAPGSGMTPTGFLTLRYDAADSRIVLACLKDSLTEFEIATAALPISSWARRTIYDSATDAQPPDMDQPSGMYVCGISPNGDQLLLASDYYNSSIGFTKTAFYVGSFQTVVVGPPPSSRLRNTFE